MGDELWYHRGLRFECNGCGACCTGAPGYVWVHEEEILALAKAVRVSVEDFESTCVRQVGPRKSLSERENGDCVLFNPEKRECAAYHSRPRQCRTWPFWHSTVRTRDDWKQTCLDCPGCGTGPLISAPEILRRVRTIHI